MKDILAARGDIDLFIYDEATAIKDGQSNRFKYARQLLNKTKARFWPMTGSPTPNRPVPMSLSTMAHLRRMGIDVPSTIMTRYNWPGRYDPFDHQKVTSEFLTLWNMAIVLNDMGTGKTASALWAADHLKNEGLIRTTLVMAPLSTLHSVWDKEIFTVVPHRSACILHAERGKRQKLARTSKADFLLLNHDGLGIVKDILAARGDIDLGRPRYDLHATCCGLWSKWHP